MARRDRSPRPMLRPEGLDVSGQTERMLEPEADPLSPTEVMSTGLTEEILDKAEKYIDNPPPPTQQSPVQKAIDKSLIGGPEENYEIKISKLTPEGRGAIRGMISRVLGKEFNGDLDAFYYCTTFVSDMLNSIGADPLDDKGNEYNRTRANAYMKYGTPVNIEDIQEGDIVIFDFPKLPDGSLTLDPSRGKRNGLGDHATFYAGDRLEVNKPGSDFIGVLGGEQGGGAAISMKAFDKSHILGIRRIQYNNIDYNFTKEMSKVNPEFNKFLDEQAKQFDFNAFENQFSDPIQGSNRLTSSFDEGGLAKNDNLDLARSYGVTVVDPEETDQTLKALGKAAVESIPGISTAATIRDIKEELEKEDPSLAKVGVLAASEVVGLVPGLGDVAQTMIRKGADKVTRIIKPAANREELLADAPENAQEVLGITEKQKEDWRKSKPKRKQVRTPQLQKGLEAYLDNEITYQEYLELADNFRPIVPIKEAPELPTTLDIVSSLKPQQVEKGIIGVTKEIEDGTRVASRLDINAYESFDTWVVSFHDGLNDSLSGASIGYGQVAVLENVNFKTIPKAAANIAKGKTKTTIARIFGDYKNADPEAVHQMAKDILADPDSEWVQVGMNPYRHSFFYDKADGMPVTEASEVIQVGPLVLARNVKKVSRDDPQFSFLINKNDPESIKNFNQGGPVMQEQMEMAFMQEGGIKDDGMKRDPVSGNEIPPGSMASEVRDDIPAMLSEGEYVVPADVLRFYGVNFFENLRNKAKSGLQNMEANGRIGGEPLSPDQVQQNMSGQPQAGAPARMPVAANTGPYMAGQPQGLQQAQQMSQNFNPMNYGVVGGSTLGGGQQQQSVTTFKTFVHAVTGETRVLEYINGKLKNASDQQYTVPPYYEFGSSALKKAQNTVTQAINDNDGEGQPPDNDPLANTSWMDGIDFNDAASIGNTAKGLLGLSTEEKVGIGIAGAVAGVPGMAVAKTGLTANGVAQARALSNYARNDLGNEELANQIDEDIKSAIEQSPIIGFLDKTFPGLMAGKRAYSQIKDTETAPGFRARAAVQRAEVAKGAAAQKAKDEEAAKKALKAAQKSNSDDKDFNVTDVSIDRDPMGQATMSTTYGSGDDAVTFTADEDGLYKGGLMARKKAKKKK